MLIAFALHSDAGAPVLDAAPTFRHYCGADGTPASRPAISHLGGGVYGFTSSPTDDQHGRAYLVETGHNPAFVAGSLGIGRFLAFAIYDSAGQPLPDASPAFDAYLDRHGDALPEPSIVDLGAGLYGFDPGPIRAGFTVATGAEPPTYSGTANPEDFGGDHTLPVVEAFDPAPGTPIYADTPLAFDALDDSMEAPHVLLVVRYPGSGRAELAHDGFNFAPNYEGTRTPKPGGYRFTGFLRRGGWPSSPTLAAYRGTPL